MKYGILGGTYKEVCLEPYINNIGGSGFRAITAIERMVDNSNKIDKDDIYFHSSVQRGNQKNVKNKLFLPDKNIYVTNRDSQVEFRYSHPLKEPKVRGLPLLDSEIPKIEVLNEVENLLVFDFIEADINCRAEKLVYDPQSGDKSLPPSQNNLKSEKMCIVGNIGEISTLASKVTGRKLAGKSLSELAEILIKNEGLQFIVVKRGFRGLDVFYKGGAHEAIPTFITPEISLLGSGDIFSSVFSYYWMICEEDPSDAAELASLAVAVFSDNNSIIPLPNNFVHIAEKYEDFYLPNSKSLDDKTIYLAGPFFSLHEKWIIEECHRILEDWGFNVFSPMHDVGILGKDISEDKLQEVVEEDLAEVDSCDAILSILDNYDPGTSFELGFGVKHDLPTHIILHSTSSAKITMFKGSQCKIHDDFSTALFSIAWDICT